MANSIEIAFCRNADWDSVVVTSKERAEFYGVYRRQPLAEWVADFDTLHDASRFAAELAEQEGLPVVFNEADGNA